jgi:rod shape-determining protein MreC
VARAVRSGTRADTAALAACVGLALLCTVLPAPIRGDVASALRRTAVAPLIRLQQQAERARSALAERESIAARLDSLALHNAELAELEQENDRLRRLIGLGNKLRWGFVPAEALHVRTLADENSIIVTAGATAGVVERAPVVAPAGLVGLVSAVDPHTSLVILWTHPEFRVSAMAANGTAFGIITPHSGDDPERFLLELRGVAFRQALKPGTLIRSSGLGGVFPRGIPIGSVIGEINTSEGWARTYLIRPVVEPPDVTNVMVLLPGRATGDLTALWPSAESVDSAQRRIAAAGDSLARLDALRDSIRRDSVRRSTPRPDSIPLAPRERSPR